MTKSRWVHYMLSGSDRPHTLYEYYVTGRGRFPFDMLRYDAAWPASGEDAVLIANCTDGFAPKSDLVSVKLNSYREPTVARWSSFIWSVGTEKL